MARVSFEDVVGDGARDDQGNAESGSMARLATVAPLGIPFFNLLWGGASECFNRWLLQKLIYVCLSLGLKGSPFE